MIIRIINNRWLQLEQIPPDMEDVVYHKFSAKDPKSRYITNVDEQSWDGYYRKYNRHRKSLAKSFLVDLVTLCKAYNFPYEIWDDRRNLPDPFKVEDVIPNLLNGIELMEHQVEGVKACLKHEIGTFFMTTGAGKTEIMCAIAALMRVPTLIVAEERVVLEQIKTRLELRDIVDEVGIFYAGKTPTDSLICVGSIASLIPPAGIKRKEKEAQDKFDLRLKAYKTRITNSRKYQEIAAGCELLMIDEADKASSDQYRKLIMKHTNSRYLYGFTGSLPEKEKYPVDWLKLRESVGPIIARSNRRELEAQGRIIPVKYLMKTFGEKGDSKNDSAFDVAQKEWMDENEDFHNLINKITTSLDKENFLILVENIALGEKLEQLIQGSKFIYGSTPVKKRTTTLQEFENKELRVLIGSKILKRGLDLKGGIENLIICASSKKNSEIDQKIGRPLRLNNRGWARVFDFYFVCNKYLMKHSRERLKRMIDLGYPTTVITPNGKFDGEKVLSKGFNIVKMAQPKG